MKKKDNTVNEKYFLLTQKKIFLRTLSYDNETNEKSKGNVVSKNSILNALLRQAFGKTVISGCTRMLGLSLLENFMPHRPSSPRYKKVIKIMMFKVCQKTNKI